MAFYKEAVSALEALGRVSNEILEVSEETEPEKLANLGANYLAYEEETQFLLTNSSPKENASSDLFIGRLQVVLTEARRGEYSGVKQELNHIATEVLAQCTRSTVRDRHFMLGKKLQYLASHIPPSGEPFKLPKPASLQKHNP